MKNSLKKIALSLSTAVLFYLAWPPRDLFFLAFVALVPLFILEEQTRGKKGYYPLIFLGLFAFNVLNTWWVWYASDIGSIFMLFANTALMSLPFVLYRKAQRNFGTNKALFAFICYWLAFEYLHLNWELTWPWLSLGNVFAKHNSVVQWYEYTGMLGGSLWVLIVNVLIYKLIHFKDSRQVYQLSAVLLLPIGISWLIGLRYLDYPVKGQFLPEVLIVQPNIDPYEKFNSGMEIQSTVNMLNLVEPYISDKTSYIILPETAIVEYIDEDYANSFESLKIIRTFLSKHPGLHFISGASTYNFYDQGEKIQPTARTDYEGRKYESYNTSLEIDSLGIVNKYHKSKLVPGVEKMPYPKIFGFLEKWSIDLGGVSGSLGSDDSVTVFKAGDKPDLAPLICYESVFPGFVREFVHKGANIILVMTNDGWWEDTDGYKQHLYYACLRAIENRREVLRAANTGISCHINRHGKIMQRTKWWEADVLIVNVRSYDNITFYTKYGDYIGRFASFFAVALALGAFVKSKTIK